MKLFIHYYIYVLTVAAVLCACSDNVATEFDFTVAGAPAKISVNVTVPEMQVQTRAKLPDDHANRVETLWVRVYNSSTGEATSDAVVLEEIHTDTHVPHKIKIDAKSGPSYIAAVANIDTEARRYTVADDGSVTYEEGTLRGFLEEADTWEKFCAISVLAPVSDDGTTSVSMPLDFLPMSGVYYQENLDHGLIDWEEGKNTTPVTIPETKGGTYGLPGAIHLRRLVSHVTFNLIPDNGVTITPQSYSVRNVPKESWAYERSGKSGETGVPVAPGLNRRNATEMTVTAQDNTANALEDTKAFGTAYIEEGAAAGAYTFDFYQMENKHEGHDNVTAYSDREKEFKTPTDADGAAGTNTGIYRSLCPDGNWNVNNTATCVEIRCHVSPANIENLPENPTRSESTFGYAVFTVHLGYCEGSGEEEKARDFKCRRNTDYTYNVHIAGVNSIYVEAHHNSLSQEKVPGMEGTVTRITGGSYELDAHYGVFNVCLSNAERAGLDAEIGNGFGFIIHAYEDGALHDINEENYTEFSPEYYDWVEFIPTKRQDELAKYDPKKVIKITQMNDVKNHPHSEGDTKVSDTSDKWYTVHVNENVYETSADETAGRWKKYVNQPSRYCWIKVNRSISPDRESLYVVSKYAFSQKSIQTYYTTNISDNIGALGVEHRNESRGLNLRAVSQHVESVSNGRNNYYHYVNWSGRIDYKWDKVLDAEHVQTIGEVKAQGVHYPAYTLPSQSDNVLTVPRLRTTVTEAEVKDNTGMTGIGFSTDYEPQPGGLNKVDLQQFMEAANACTNRNRDNNGDGKIDPEEVRWYIPTMGKYLRVILGRNSLTTPLMDYAGVGGKLYYPIGNPVDKHADKGKNTRFKAYSSDRKVLWAMEGLSVSDFGQSWTTGFWEVRCVRNLGTNLTTLQIGNDKDNDGTTPAFQHDSENSTVSLTHYDARSVRPYRDMPLPVHDITDQQHNMCARKFEYVGQDKEIAINYGNTTEGIISAIAANPCRSLNAEAYRGHTDWRVPNQKEMSIMRNLELVQSAGAMLSCTQEHFDVNGYANGNGDRRFLVAATGHTYALTASSGTALYVRCVRDVE